MVDELLEALTHEERGRSAGRIGWGNFGMVDLRIV